MSINNYIRTRKKLGLKTISIQREITFISNIFNKAKYCKEVIKNFLVWIDHDQDEYYLIAWGHTDLESLKSECKNNNVDTEWLQNNVDLNLKYIRLKKFRDPVSLLGALTLEGFEFEGIQHRAEDDAFNTTKIFIKYLADWDIYKY